MACELEMHQRPALREPKAIPSKRRVLTTPAYQVRSRPQALRRLPAVSSNRCTRRGSGRNRILSPGRNSPTAFVLAELQVEMNPSLEGGSSPRRCIVNGSRKPRSAVASIVSDGVQTGLPELADRAEMGMSAPTSAHGGKTGRDLLNLRLVGFDPQRSSGALRGTAFVSSTNGDPAGFT